MIMNDGRLLSFEQSRSGWNRTKDSADTKDTDWNRAEQERKRKVGRPESLVKFCDDFLLARNALQCNYGSNSTIKGDVTDREQCMAQRMALACKPSNAQRN